MTLFIIISIVALAVWAYIDYNAAKATGRWAMSGVKGVGADINALKAEAKLKQVENPERQDEIFTMLNDDFIDLEGYRKGAVTRSLNSHKTLAEEIAKHI